MGALPVPAAGSLVPASLYADVAVFDLLWRPPEKDPKASAERTIELNDYFGRASTCAAPGAPDLEARSGNNVVPEPQHVPRSDGEGIGLTANPLEEPQHLTALRGDYLTALATGELDYLAPVVLRPEWIWPRVDWLENLA